MEVHVDFDVLGNKLRSGRSARQESAFQKSLVQTMVSGAPYRIAGHESFPCRYTWLPKAVRGLSQTATLFADEDQAMVDLGLGKNMVRSARFWALVTGVATPAVRGQGYEPTEFGLAVLGSKGADPFLEDIRTLWLIHWQLCTLQDSPLLAWNYLFNFYQEPNLIPSAVLKVLQKEALKHETSVSPVTLEQHFETFLHTYVPTRGRKGEVLEDNLDCPLVELELITKIGERPTDEAGRMESIYAFRREEKPDITPELFLYCLNAFWEQHHPGEKTLRFRDVAHGAGGPGQVFKLPEEDVRVRADRLRRDSNGLFVYSESATSQLIHRTKSPKTMDLLLNIYKQEAHSNG